MNTEQTNETKTGYCDICGTRETDTTANLKADGWYLGQAEHFCPNCND